MFRGEKINVTENGPSCMWLCVLPKTRALLVDGNDVVPEVHCRAGQDGGFL
jgi:hypothetical protein